MFANAVAIASARSSALSASAAAGPGTEISMPPAQDRRLPQARARETRYGAVPHSTRISAVGHPAKSDGSISATKIPAALIRLNTK